jgi:hypothetical protein
MERIHSGISFVEKLRLLFCFLINAYIILKQSNYIGIPREDETT